MHELSHLAVIEASGADAARFLHAQLSAAVDDLAAGEARYACLCQPQGREIALLLVCRSGDGFALVCAASLADTVLARLSRYVLRDKVRLQRAPGVAVSGLAAGEVAQGAVFEPLPGLRYALASGAPGGGEDFRARELAQGVAWLDAASSEVFLPQMLGAEEIGALDWRKGCFPGQEVIARTRYLGRLKQRAVVVSSGDDWPAAAALQLTGPGTMAEAVLVDRARDGSGAFVALLVVRTPEPFAADGLVAGEARHPVSARWLAASSKRT